jgi:hypothetical protein
MINRKFKDTGYYQKCAILNYTQILRKTNFPVVLIKSALIKGTRSFVARALKNALMRKHRLPALGS